MKKDIFPFKFELKLRYSVLNSLIIKKNSRCVIFVKPQIVRNNNGSQNRMLFITDAIIVFDHHFSIHAWNHQLYYDLNLSNFWITCFSRSDWVIWDFSVTSSLLISKSRGGNVKSYNCAFLPIWGSCAVMVIHYLITKIFGKFRFFTFCHVFREIQNGFIRNFRNIENI